MAGDLALEYVKQAVAVLGRDRGLTSAEQAVVELLIGGMTNAEIAAARGVSLQTAKSQVASVLHKLEARTRSAVLLRALEHSSEAEIGVTSGRSL